MEKLFGWMAWTTPVAIFFICILLMLVGMTIWELRSPTVERKGFLPMRTTRGDRLFIGLLASAYVNLAWVGLTDINQWAGTTIGFIVLLIVMRKG
ncbi:MAG: putative small integral membrane protein [Janthinobacterium sp.]|jgi:predicted small integral membrane protein